MNRGVADRPRTAGDVLLVDPSLFTAPYDACLSRGLADCGLRPVWATRAQRPGEEDDLCAVARVDLFYPLTDGPARRTGGWWRLVKGVEHAVGLRKLVKLAGSLQPAVVHLQWLLVPALDARAIRKLRSIAPVVITVHDALPFNGKAVNRLQRQGLHASLRLADRLIVHTTSARERLVEQQLPRERIAIVPHGLLRSSGTPKQRSNDRWTIVQLGKMQSYKGIDLLVEALGRISQVDRRRLRVIVAGEALIDLQPIERRAAELQISHELLEIRAKYQSKQEIEQLLDVADTFVFPYRAIEASGALLLVAGAGKWIVASDLGAFSELVGYDRSAGSLVAAGDVGALAQALLGSIGRRPTRNIAERAPSWTDIGRLTDQVYKEASRDWGNAASCRSC